MDAEDVIKRILVTDLFAEVPAELMDRDDGLRSVIGLDSLGFTELRVQCESEFDILISDEDFNPDNFRSIRTLGLLVNRLRGVTGTTAEAARMAKDV